MNPLEIPNIEISTFKDKTIPSLTLNLTPDSYNALVNIMSVLNPDS